MWPLDHDDEQDPALVPTADPANAPAIDAIADGSRPEEPQELGLDLHTDLSMALLDRTVKAMTDAEGIIRRSGVAG